MENRKIIIIAAAILTTLLTLGIVLVSIFSAKLTLIFEGVSDLPISTYQDNIYFVKKTEEGFNLANYSLKTKEVRELGSEIGGTQAFDIVWSEDYTKAVIGVAEEQKIEEGNEEADPELYEEKKTYYLVKIDSNKVIKIGSKYDSLLFINNDELLGYRPLDSESGDEGYFASFKIDSPEKEIKKIEFNSFGLKMSKFEDSILFVETGELGYGKSYLRSLDLKSKKIEKFLNSGDIADIEVDNATNHILVTKINEAFTETKGEIYSKEKKLISKIDNSYIPIKTTFKDNKIITFKTEETGEELSELNTESKDQLEKIYPKGKILWKREANESIVNAIWPIIIDNKIAFLSQDKLYLFKGRF